MEFFEKAQLHQHAAKIMEAVRGTAQPARQDMVKAFMDVALAIIKSGEQPGDAVKALSVHSSQLIQAIVKADSPAASFSSGNWGEENIAALAAAYIASIAELSLLDQIKKYAREIPHNGTRVMVASGFSGDVVAEGDPKVVKVLNPTLADMEATKIAGIVVATEDLLDVGGDAVLRLIERELREGMPSSSNNTVISMLITSNSIPVAATGDPLQDLRAGLQAATPSLGYVVAAGGGVVADLATRVENSGGMGVRGGTFVTGVDVVAVDGLQEMIIVPASRLALRDYGLSLRSAGHASLMMSDTPTSPAELVSMWQTNSRALLVEREFNLLVDGVESVVVS